MDTGCKKDELDTPCLVLDLDKLDRNIELVHGAVDAQGKQVRPHAKTHKCSRLARRQVEAGAVGVCVAKVSEAEALIEAGLTGILITGPQATRRKVEQVVALWHRSPDLLLVVDDMSAARLLSGAVSTVGVSAGVLVDVDVGLERTGVRLEQVSDFALAVDALPGLSVRGIQAYAGHLQHVLAFSERRSKSLSCLRGAAEAFMRVKTVVPTCDIFSGSGTGTVDIDIGIPELTELQPGSYVFMDAEYAVVESLAGGPMSDRLLPALTLLTSVVSANHDGHVTVDAGLKSLYRHGGTPRVLRPGGLVYDWFGDEYGRVTAEAGYGLPVPGAVLELMVSHCDPTVNLFDCYHVCRGDTVVGTWPIDLRGCCR